MTDSDEEYANEGSGRQTESNPAYIRRVDHSLETNDRPASIRGSQQGGGHDQGSASIRDQGHAHGTGGRNSSMANIRMDDHGRQNEYHRQDRFGGRDRFGGGGGNQYGGHRGSARGGYQHGNGGWGGGGGGEGVVVNITTESDII